MRPLLLLAALAFTAAPALAQTPSDDANYGEVSLDEYFTPDPHEVSLTAGGGIEVNVPGCGFGSVSEAPDYKVTYTTGGSQDLVLYATSSDDTTLLVNLPDGSWACDDDGYSMADGDGDPLLVFPAADGGRYDIWVGTFGGGTAEATLYISESNPMADYGDYDDGYDGQEDSEYGTPDFTADANFGSVDLDEYFTPDPHSVDITAGGSITPDVSGCEYGSVSEAPDYKVVYTTEGNQDLVIFATSSDDTTLLVNLPDGSWACDDDSYSMSEGDGDPLLIFPRAASGRYDIWVGTYGGGTAEATLHVSESDPR